MAGQPTSVYTYDQRGNLTLAVTNGLTTTFVYNGHNQRLQLSVNGQPTTYLLDYARGGNRVLQESNAMETKFYLYGDTCLAELVETDNPAEPEQRYYLYDGSQTVRQTVNEQAEPTYAWTFSPEGAVLLGEEGPVSHLSCVGDAVYDWSTGLIFKGGKYYDPRSDLWLTFGSPAVVWAINRYNGYGSKRQNKKQDKRFFWLLFLFLVLFLLAGCASENGDDFNEIVDINSCRMLEKFTVDSKLAEEDSSEITVNINIVRVGDINRDVQKDVTYANEVYKQANIQIQTINEFNVSDLGYSSSDFLNDSGKLLGGPGTDHSNLFELGTDGANIVIYYVPEYRISDGFIHGEGFSHGQNNEQGNSKTGKVIMSNYADKSINMNKPRTLAHELGHVWGLNHPNYDISLPHQEGVGDNIESWYTEYPYQMSTKTELKNLVENNIMRQSSSVTANNEDLLTSEQIKRIRVAAAEGCN